MANTVVSLGTVLTVGYSETGTPTGTSTPLNSGSMQYNPTAFSSGTGAGQVDRLYVNQATITASGSLTITLTSYTDPLNATVSMLRIKEIFINLLSGGASAIVIGNATHPIGIFSAGSTTMTLNTGSPFYLAFPLDATGIPITASSTDQLKIVNSDGANAAVVNIQIKGCSA